ncbi:MAG: RNA 2',3'-cyclic phosphodiesterase [Promethearchaeota archaeon]|nr:MAG: RNA 2',3'-cyclic phosphodiesterase [Candidatus Lokiarchaeota archaeon]
MIRTFIAFELQEETTLSEIRNFTNRLKQNQKKIKIVKLDNIHLTVKFLGNIQEDLVPKIYDILEREVNTKILHNQEHMFSVKGVGHYRNYEIIWVGLEGDFELLQTVKDTVEEKLNQQLKIKKDKRRKFTPHITIARLKKNKKDYKTFDSFKETIKESRNRQFGECALNEIVLKKSDLTPKGPIYTTFNGKEFI